jgi:hypothetical protein
MAEIDLSKLSTKKNIALTRRGRLEEGGAAGQVASGYGLGMSSLVSDAAAEAASSGLIPVANPQVMKGMRLDQRSMGGFTFADLKEDIEGSRGDNREPRGDGTEGYYEGSAASGQGVYGRGTGPTDFYASGRDADGNFVDDGSIAMARGGDLASATMGRMASGALSKGLVNAGAATLAGFGEYAGLAGVSSAFGSLIGTGMFGALNQIGGAVVGSGIGDSIAGEANTAQEKSAREAARMAATGNYGLVGMGVRGIGSWLGDLTGLWDSDSPYEDAQQAYDSSNMVADQKAAGEQWAQGLDTTPEKSAFDKLTSKLGGMFSAPDVQKAENKTMGTAGDKGVLTKDSSQQQYLAEKKGQAADTAEQQRVAGLQSELKQLTDRYNELGEKARDNHGATYQRRIREIETQLGIGRTGGYTGIQGRQGSDRSGGMTGGQPGVGETGGGDYGGASRGESGTIGGL